MSRRSGVTLASDRPLFRMSGAQIEVRKSDGSESRARGSEGGAPVATKLFVGGLSYSTTSESLREYFAQCGTVESATVITDRATGQSRGFGFVEMASSEDGEKAIAALNGTQVGGRTLNVNEARPKAERGGGGGGGGGGRGRDRGGRGGGGGGGGNRW